MADQIHDAERLAELQALPLERKIQITQTRIIEWYQRYNGKVCVSFSGGKDSTVLLHIARQIYPDIPAVFSNTGLEYPEIQRFAKSVDNVDIVTPSMRFDQVISTYGYPLISKEVAEAIYYARRIRSQVVNVEREREKQATGKRKRKELYGIRTRTRTIRQYVEEQNCVEQSSGKHQNVGNRPETRQSMWETSSKRLELRGGENQRFIRTSTARNRRTVLSGRMPGAGVTLNGNTGNGGIFSNSEEQVPEKSQFNKEKWLHLARDVPAMISHYCCFKMKKSPIKQYQHKNHYYPILGTLAEESRVRKQAWIRHGCNAFDSKNPTSQPLSFWTEQDILAYIVENNLDIASVYGEIVCTDEYGNNYPPVDLIGNARCNLRCTGCQRTGCIFCGFDFHLERGETRFQLLAKTHPRQYDYAINGGQWVDNPAYDPTAPKMDGEWQNWNPKQIWVPSKQGLGMGKVFDMANEIYGKDFYRYE